MKYSLIRFYAAGAEKLKVSGLPKRKAEELVNLLNDELDVESKMDRDEPYDYYGYMKDDTAEVCYTR